MRGLATSRVAAMLTVLTLSACVGQNEVLFVTNTNVGINLDSKPPTIGIAFDREEGYIGPAYTNGAMAPVVARLASNLNVFSPEVHQVYATGDAAKLLVDQSPNAGNDRPLQQNAKRAAYFVTESSIGLRVTFASNVPDSVHLGYRRKEFSFIPIGTAANGSCTATSQAPPPGAGSAGPVDCYGSTLAIIDLGGNVSDPQHIGMQVDQMFATGRAAELLAAYNDDTRKLFGQKLGITEKIVGDGTCDAGCSRLQAYITKNGDAGRTAVRQKCMALVGVNSITPYLFSSTYQGSRQACAASLKA